MPDMINPYDILIQFQDALSKGLITVQRCDSFPDLYYLIDDADGNLRITFAFIENHGLVKALAIYIQAENYDYTICYGIAYAVAENYRNEGVAKSIIKKSIVALQNMLPEHINEFYVEAIVGISNIPSQRVAEEIFSKKPKKVVDAHSLQDAYQYIKLFKK